MEVLYIGSDLNDAQAVATALRGIDPAVNVAWAAHLDHATKWLEDHRDLAALIVDAPADGGDWPSLVTHLRAVALRPAVVLIVPDDTTSAPFHPDADDCLRRDQFLFRDLPLVTTRAIDRIARVELERKLAQTAKLLAERQAQHEVSIARTAATWEMVDEQLRAAAVQVERARQSEESATADVQRLTRRDAEISSQLAEATAAHRTLERRLADLQATSTRTEQERLAVTQELAERQREFQAQIADAIEQRRGVDTLLAQAIDAREAAERQHASAIADVARLTTHEADLNELLTDVTASRADLEDRLAATEAAYDDAVTRTTRERLSAIQRAAEREAELDGQIRREHATRVMLEQTIADTAADVERLTEREADLTSQLTELQAARDTLERQLTDATGALHLASEREAELAELIQKERATRTTLEQAIAHAEAGLRDLRQQHEATLDASAAERTDLTERLRNTDSALDQTRQDHRSAAADVERLRQREADLASELALVHATRDTLERTLADTRAQFAGHRQQLEVQLAQQALEHESRLADIEEHSRALARERDALQQSFVTLQERSRQLEESLEARIEAFEVSRAESHRLFEQAGVAMFRCTRDGALTGLNRACTTLVGRRTLDELEGVDFAAAVFEAPQALSWLIERSASTRAKETVETTWRRQDGSRLFVRLSARALPSGVIEVVAEDLTRLRVLEERLARAHRMEAVGRLASEVSSTCSSLLANIDHQGREWLTRTGDADFRQRGERLLEEVERAAGLLQELAVCGDEQVRTPTLVDLNTLVRDLEPVLKSVAGVEVDVQLRDASTPLNVDVGTERVERLLVNLASYGRGRIAHGGRLRIELGTSVVDRHFSAKHPNVRLGLHAMITVTESRAADDEGVQPRETAAVNGSPRRQRPGVDFATLQGLVSDCGGHLWMKVQPLGEMVAKIRLPLSSPQEQRVPRGLATRGARERQAGRWAQS